MLPRVVRLPRVYRPQEDTRLLAAALAEAAPPSGARVLDICSGSGVLALTAAMMGTSEVVAVDISARAITSIRLNAAVRRLPVRALHGDVTDALRLGRFDVVLANPPYVPGSVAEDATCRNWLGGPDGRQVLDPLCDNASDLLENDGCMLLVQSEFADVDATLARLRGTGLKAATVARTRIPFGPVLRRQAEYLEATGGCVPGVRTEELIVVRADKLVVPR